ncbi:hypothetical protein MGN70_002563 [Eutypa lata]|nr:hypothetical protein MGN70_002563 [Eutypa lata]
MPSQGRGTETTSRQSAHASSSRITAPNLTLIRGEGRGIAEEGSISAALLAVKAALETDIWSLVQSCRVWRTKLMLE